MTGTDVISLQKKSIELRKKIFEIVKAGNAGHTGSSLSCADILTTLYYHVMNVDPTDPENENRDRYIQSKGQAVEILWAVLADKGYIAEEELKTFSQFNSRLIGHPNNEVDGIEMNTGSLGHGLAVSTGIALAGKIDKKEYRTYTLMGDGELAEGSVWEAALAAANYELGNLTAIIDYNKLQITGEVKDVMNVEPLADKWRAFGWHVIEVDGHDFAEMIEAFDSKENGNKPKMVIAHTIKGKGISIAENQASWHHKVPTDDEFKQAMEELDTQLEGLK